MKTSTKFLILAFTCMLAFASCTSFNTSSGDANVAYESGGFINVLTNYSPFPNNTATSKMYVDNANPHADIIGATLNGNTMGDVVDFTLSNLRVEFIDMYCQTPGEMTQYFDKCELIVADRNDQNQTILATSSNFNGSSQELEFTINDNDYTSLFGEVFYDNLIYFKFYWNGYPEEIEVKYRMIIGGQYEYQSEN